MILISNTLPSARNEAFKAVPTRVDLFELSASNKEAMRNTAAKVYHNLNPADCETVIEFIAENSADRALSPRLLSPSLRKLTP